MDSDKKGCSSKHTFMSFLLGLIVGVYPMRWMTVLVAFGAGLMLGLALPLVKVILHA